MNFAAIAVGAGIVGALFVAYIQGPPAPKLSQVDATGFLDATATGSIDPAGSLAAGKPGQIGGDAVPPALRLIDLRSGATCKIASPEALDDTFAPAPLGPDCAGSPDLGGVAQWRAMDDGSLEMADTQGRTVLRFIPGDGVLYESIFPDTAMVTIVPARG